MYKRQLFKSPLYHVNILTRKTYDQIHVNVIVSQLSCQMKRFFCLLHSMSATDNIQGFLIQDVYKRQQQRILEFDLASELHHGMLVSNLAYAVAEEMGLPHEQCYELAIAGMLHDIGKLKLTSYINGQEQDPLVIEELKYVRMHSALGYEELKGQGYSDFVLESILYHHENYDGSGYPSNKAGDDIPIRCV